MARGEFVCLLQDDDLPPASGVWVNEALTLLQTFPELMFLGGRDGMDILEPSPADPDKPQEYYEREGDIMEWRGIHKVRLHMSLGLMESKTGIPFRFVTAVNRAPVFIRRKEFLELGGIDQSYAPVILDDDEACIRAWLANYRVGVYRANFKRGVDLGGMSLFNRELVKRQVVRNSRKLYGKYAKYIDGGHLATLVDTANTQLSSTGTRGS